MNPFESQSNYGYDEGFYNLLGSRKKKKLTTEERAWSVIYPYSDNLGELKASITEARAKFKTLPSKNRQQRIKRDALSSYITKMQEYMLQLSADLKEEAKSTTSGGGTTGGATSGSGATTGGQVGGQAGSQAGSESASTEAEGGEGTGDQKQKLNKYLLYGGIGLVGLFVVYKLLKK
jgi:hypothetical protein